MNYTEQFNQLMAKQTKIALATSVNNEPNVRIVNFYFDPEKKLLYFTTFNRSAKVAEFAENNVVAFTTVPEDDSAHHVRAQHATITLSTIDVNEILDGFVKKIPDYATNVQMAGANLNIYEVQFAEAKIILDPAHSGVVTV